MTMRKVLNLFGSRRRARMERELDRELRYHFDRRVADMQARDLSEYEARRRVAIEWNPWRIAAPRWVPRGFKAAAC
jgi:hypothetical protein